MVVEWFILHQSSGDCSRLTPSPLQVQGVRDTWALPEEDPSLQVETVHPELPHPDFDEDETTVEPEMTEFYHGEIDQSEAEGRLNRRKEGQFLLRAAPSKGWLLDWTVYTLTSGAGCACVPALMIAVLACLLS